jgi:hypothetical protein
MRLHIDRGKGFYTMPPFQITGAPPYEEKSAMCQPATLGPRPIEKQPLRLESPSQVDAKSDDSPMITALFEAHLSMEKFLAAFAELRGDDAEGAIG